MVLQTDMLQPELVLACHPSTMLKVETVMHLLSIFRTHVSNTTVVTTADAACVAHLRERVSLMDNVRMKLVPNNNLVDFGKWMDVLGDKDIPEQGVVLANDSFMLVQPISKFWDLVKSSKWEMCGLTRSSELSPHAQSFCRWYSQDGIGCLRNAFRKHTPYLQHFNDIIRVLEVDLCKDLTWAAAYDFPKCKGNIHFDLPANVAALAQGYPVVKVKQLPLVRYNTTYTRPPSDFRPTTYVKMNPDLLHLSLPDAINQFITDGQHQGRPYKPVHYLPTLHKHVFTTIRRSKLIGPGLRDEVATLQQSREQKTDGRVLVCYASYVGKKGSDQKLRRETVQFFISQAIEAQPAHGNVDYVLAFNGPVSITVPKRSDVQVLRRANVGYDFGAHQATLLHVMNRCNVETIEQLPYDNFVFINDSARGPFISPSVPVDQHWTRSFTSRLHTADMVGTHIVMLDGHGRRKNINGPCCEGFCFALTRTALNIVWAKETVFTQHNTKEDTIEFGEYGCSCAIVNAGGVLDCLLYRGQTNYDWSSPEMRRWNGNIHPSREGSYYTSSSHPLETMFHKVYWRYNNSFVNRAEMSKYTRWAYLRRQPPLSPLLRTTLVQSVRAATENPSIRNKLPTLRAKSTPTMIQRGRRLGVMSKY